MNMIVNPVKTFNQLKTEEKFPLTALIILLVLTLINLILNVPIGAKAGELVLSSTSLPEAQMDMAIQMTHKLRYLTMIGGFVMSVIMLFVYPLILLAIARIFKTQLTYAKALRLIIYCLIISAIGALVNTAFVYFKGIDNLTGMYDSMRIGLNMLTSVESVGASLYIFLYAINPFEIWYLVLLIIGIKIFTNSAWTKSLLICIIFWLIVTLFPVITTYFSQAVMANKGLIG